MAEKFAYLVGEEMDEVNAMLVRAANMVNACDDYMMATYRDRFAADATTEKIERTLFVKMDAPAAAWWKVECSIELEMRLITGARVPHPVPLSGER